MRWPKSLQPQFSAALSPCPCEWGRVGHQHLLAMPCSVQEQNAGNDRGLGRLPFFPSRGYLMAPPGSHDIFTVYLIEEFAGRMFLALHE